MDRKSQGFWSLLHKYFHCASKIMKKIHLPKWNLFATKIRWCVKPILSECLCYSQLRMNGLLTMELPTNECNLEQFLLSQKLVKYRIFDFTSLIMPIHDFIEHIYSLRKQLYSSRESYSSLNTWLKYNSAKCSIKKQTSIGQSGQTFKAWLIAATECIFRCVKFKLVG